MPSSLLQKNHTCRLQTPGSFPASHRPAFTTLLFSSKAKKTETSIIYHLEGTFFPQNYHLQNYIWYIIRNETQPKTRYQQVSVLKLLGRSSEITFVEDNLFSILRISADKSKIRSIPGNWERCASRFQSPGGQEPSKPWSSPGEQPPPVLSTTFDRSPGG